MRSSAEGYDAGRTAEAKNLAIRLRTLLYERGQSRALLRQVGRGDILFFDTAGDPMPGNYLPHFGLVVVSLASARVLFTPPNRAQPLGPPVGLLPFEDWWQHRPVITLPGQFTFTRRSLVLTMADQDGGAHVDPEIDEEYYRLTRGNALGLTTQLPNGREAPVELIAQASIRQIAEEVMRSIATGLHEIPADLVIAEPPPTLHVSVDARTGIRTERWIRATNVCPCKSGRPYSECHGAPRR